MPVLAGRRRRLVFARRSGGPDPAGLTREELGAVLRAARSLNRSGDLPATLEAVLGATISLLDADEGSVMLLDERSGELTIRAAQGIPEQVVRDVRVPVGRGISGHVAASGTPLLLGSDAEVERYADDRDRQSRLRSAMSVPLRVRDRTTGVLNINLVRGGSGRPEFEQRDLDLVAVFAEFAAAAAQTRELYDQALGRAQELSFLFEGSHALLAATDLREVAERVLDAAEQLLGATGGFVCAAAQDQDAVEIAAYRGVTRGRVLAVVRRDGFADLLRGSEPRSVADPAVDGLLAPLVSGAGPAGCVVAPLEGDPQPRGLLVALTGPAAPDAPVLRLLSTYLNHASLAVGRAQLHRSVVAKEEELASLTSAIPDPILVVDAELRLLAVNPAAAERFGLNPAFDLGRPVLGKLRSGELESLLTDPEGGRGDVVLTDPEPRTFHARVTPTRPGHGPAGARILTLEDVTAQRETERLKADFVAVVGHELRTPLTMIKGYAGTLARRGNALSEEARGKALEAVHAQSVRLERLVEDLLLLARVEQGRPPLHLEQRDPVEVIETAVERCKAENPQREIRLHAPGRHAVVPLDATKVEQVLHHLLDNALKFSEPPEPVDVEVVVSADSVEVRVTDRGQGVFSGDVPHLFERFRQVDGTATRSHGGTGIGLYICRTLVEAHGGHIGVRSALGRGSTFWFRLPTMPPEGHRSDPGGAPPPA